MARPPASPAVRFRKEIEASIAEGVKAKNMLLRLTLGDVHKLSRDRDTPVADISYAGGEMRFLGVLVQRGGVTESVLDREAG